MKTTTFAMVKPRFTAGPLMGDVLNFIELHGFTVEEMKLVQLTFEDVAGFYKDYTGKPFYPAMSTYMTSGFVVPMILSLPSPAEDPTYCIVQWRQLLGATDSSKALPDTLRGRYGNKNGTIFQNVAHGSDSEEAYARESAIFFGRDAAVLDLVGAVDRLWDVEQELPGDSTLSGQEATELALAWNAVRDARRCLHPDGSGRLYPTRSEPKPMLVKDEQTKR